MDFITELLVACGVENPKEWEGDTDDLCSLAIAALERKDAQLADALNWCRDKGCCNVRAPGYTQCPMHIDYNEPL